MTYQIKTGFKKYSRRNTSIFNRTTFFYINTVLILLFFFNSIYSLIYSLDFFIISIGVISLLVITIPMSLSKVVDIVQPISLVAAAVFLGTTLRSIYLVTSDSPRVAFLIDGVSIGQIITNAIWIPISLACLSLGYYSIRHPQKSFIFETTVVPPTLSRCILVLLISTVFAIIGSILYLYILGFSIEHFNELFTKKSLRIEGGENGDVYTPIAALRLPIFIAQFAIYAALIELMERKSFNIRTPSFVWLFIALGIMACSIIPLFTSSRTSLLVIFVNMSIILIYYGKLNKKLMAVLIFIIISVGTTMAILRSFSVGVDSTVNLTDQTDYGYTASQIDQSAIGAIIGSGNFVDIGRIANIIDRVPERLDYFWGKTYLSIFTAFVPRVIWPEKPPVQLGGIVKNKIFGYIVTTNGWPPTIIGEAFMNFGYVGLFFIPFFYGIGIKIMYVKLFLGQRSKKIRLIYLAMLFPVTFVGMGLNVSAALANTIMPIISAIIIGHLVWGNKLRRIH